ncbi:hypothetical protein WICANDRAFT_98192 [Wickerhamomyces anomalus NRRL Y-366-8]|uniref:Uncharacterized protein n=1 Tax=Wickerhamomyces anomalus (strain ATCC 58044 / CBS 1984 / NCYC 433 / NRRL Y-366-8) TaxID=683960 RepID=A0A1E3NUE3_WICAA|nr:uncharacterized protein WICANDRAFT_98192 [Wickerhamomyces anomalus NRRL Y-366-8]ODQ56704.1 hypothetical protein WICANDRAFT_98192 [Wickerhamomyces anomalus NRRL Y-366-8]
MKFLPIVALSALFMNVQAQSLTGSYITSCETPTDTTQLLSVETGVKGTNVLILTQYAVTRYFDTCNGNTWSQEVTSTEYTEID